MLDKASRHPGIEASRHQGIEASRHRGSSRLPSGFTLTELMVAVAILLVVIVGTSKIFNTVSEVTGKGQANADVMQEAAAIERQLRADLAKLNPEGIFAIRCVRVRNNFNAPGPLLNPYLDPTAWVRADQLMFFTNGVQSSQTAGIEAGTLRFGQGSASRVYWGHAFQLPLGRGFGRDQSGRAHDPAEVVYPWTAGLVDMQFTRFLAQGGNTNQNYTWVNTTPIDGTQPPATEWLLVRQDVGLMDDDSREPDRDAKTLYMSTWTGYEYRGVVTARSLFLLDPRVGGFNSFEVRNGRMDAAASRIEDVRYALGFIPPTADPRPWEDGTNNDQRSMIADQLLYYPRAERTAPSMHRVDQALTNAVIGSACSSFIVEWTWDDGVGDVFNDDGSMYLHGVEVDPDGEQPWFGLPDIDDDVERGVYPYYSEQWWNAAESIHNDNIEYYEPTSQYFERYEAFFGYNQMYPLDPQNNNPTQDMGYTPWPNAIRITMTLHDTETKLANGRVFQFVVNLPKRPGE